VGERLRHRAPLTEARILAALKTKRFGQAVYALRRIDSTNAFARTLAARGHGEGTLVVAEQQTAGRGRWGRAWESPRGKGLWFSLLLDAGRGPGAGRLTLLAATSVAQVLERVLSLKARLRWPNDVILDGRKVAGLLVEAPRGRGPAVLGVGVNVHQRESDFPESLRGTAVSLRSALGRTVDRVALLAELVGQIERDTTKARAEGFDFVLHRWVRRNGLAGRIVTLKTRGGLETGRVRGFHASGHLVLVRPDGTEKRYADGEVVEVRHAARG
jgi:BirA family biotin operon repressor/biotin-[acetyl-CoA-carboxylase] ligase